MMNTVEQPITYEKATFPYLLIDVASQQLLCINDRTVIKAYSVSTGKKGVGEVKGSEQTPRGWHIIRAKIGQHMPINTIFVARRPQSELFSPALEASHPGKDWILTRILWLSGLELGKNRLGDYDSMQRYIYIHGCPDSKPMGVALSHGCIRMHNQDIIELFDATPVGTRVLIQG